jgi:hypothetical protein
MSFYNMLNGVNQATFYILPMLGKHPDEYPRFRDCFISEGGNIAVYTRVGGGNRNQGYGEDELYKHPNFAKTYDDDFDSTYATYEFSVPNEWKDDFAKITGGKIEEVSDAYIDQVAKVFPKLADKVGVMFGRDEQEGEGK